MKKLLSRLTLAAYLAAPYVTPQTVFYAGTAAAAVVGGYFHQRSVEEKTEQTPTIERVVEPRMDCGYRPLRRLDELLTTAEASK